jgi:K+-transporting ATPase ATPase A chain
MLIFAILAVFIAGLMIGRTPEYLGKKIQSYEMKMTSVAILVTPVLVLAGTAIAVMTEAGRAGILNPERMVFLKCCMHSLQPPTITVAHLPVSVPTHLSTTSCWRLRCGSGASP